LAAAAHPAAGPHLIAAAPFCCIPEAFALPRLPLSGAAPHLVVSPVRTIDGTRLKAVNSTDRNFTRDKLVTMIRSADERLADYLRRLDRTMPRRMGRVAVRRRT
jgi:hypothetical protein